MKSNKDIARQLCERNKGTMGHMHEISLEKEIKEALDKKDAEKVELKEELRPLLPIKRKRG